MQGISKPSDLTGCIFYYEADQGITLDLSNKISQWTDLSGNGATLVQASESLRFGYTASSINSKPTADLVNGTGNLMTATIPYASGYVPHTLLVVAKSTSTQPAAFTGIMSIGGNTGGGNTSAIGADNTRKIWIGGAGYGLPSYYAPTTGSTYFIVKCNNLRTDTGVINNVYQVPHQQGAAYNILPLNQLNVGQYTGGAGSGNWNVALIAGFNRELLSTEVSAEANYVNSKYGAISVAGSRVATSGRQVNSGRSFIT